jgi:hypothetical protein
MREAPVARPVWVHAGRRRIGGDVQRAEAAHPQPRVQPARCAHLAGDGGGDIVVLSGRATLDRGLPPADCDPDYLRHPLLARADSAEPAPRAGARGGGGGLSGRDVVRPLLTVERAAARACKGEGRPATGPPVTLRCRPVTALWPSRNRVRPMIPVDVTTGATLPIDSGKLAGMAPFSRRGGSPRTPCEVRQPLVLPRGCGRRRRG